ncbi:MAG: hypothetical protein F4Z77_07255 [Dehalococcoidia bacterium]|nr:hypothetical protein [Dehalococcoidia bacterium]MYA54135.1 hypothetical protein [Dehalococcoidia bacterium]
MERNRGGRPRHPGILTPAEQRVLEELRKGGTNAEIAVRLGLSPETVKSHIASMLSKLYLADRRQLAAWSPEAERTPSRLRAVLAVPAGLASLGRAAPWLGGGLAGAIAVAIVVAVLIVVLDTDEDLQPGPGREATSNTESVSRATTPPAPPPTASPTPAATPQTTPAPTLAATRTVEPAPAAPVSTSEPESTATRTPVAAATPQTAPTPEVTATPETAPAPTPEPTATPLSEPTATPTPATTPEPAATPSPAPTGTSEEDEYFAFHDRLDELAWVVDGTTDSEARALDSLRRLSGSDVELATSVLGFAWVEDGITWRDANTLINMQVTAGFDVPVARELLGYPWVHDGITRAEDLAILSVRELVRDNLPLAREVVGQPFLELPFLQRDEYALNSLQRMSIPGYAQGPALLARITSAPWFADGVDDDDAALLHALGNNSDAYRDALLEEHHVQATSITLPLAGAVGLAVVRHTPFPADDDMLATLVEAVTLLEEFMGVPFPVGDVTLLLVEPEFWTPSSRGQLSRFTQGSGPEPSYTRSIVVAENPEGGPPVGTIYHELGHYYDAAGPRWLHEGTAEFLEAYLHSRTGGAQIEERLPHAEAASTCSASTIWEHVNPYRGGICDYCLGEQFLLGMYQALGGDAVAAALGDLHLAARFFESPNHDSIYYAFLSNAPPGREEAFKAAFRRYHGGPFVDRTVTDTPERSALVALYNATNGDDWTINRNWLSDAPLGAWHGVSTNSTGQVTRLILVRHGLVGELPSALGRLPNLVYLDLSENELTGPLPPQLGRLTNLVQLRLQANQLEGEIPAELGNLAKLEQLMLFGSQLSGRLPPELGRLTNLRTLWVGGNQLGGTIPPELGRLASLTSLSIYGNDFSGCIAPELPDLWVSETRLPRCGAEGDATSTTDPTLTPTSDTTPEPH